MTRSEWDKVVAVIAANWPHSPPPDESIDKWFADLERFPAEQVYAVVETFSLDGERFPPTGGQIRARLAEFSTDHLDYGGAWKLAKAAAIKADPREALEWLRKRCPEAAETVSEMGGSQLSYQLENESTVRAQFRDIYAAICARGRRQEAYKGLPTGGLKALERIDGRPRKLAVTPNRAALTDGGN